MVSIHGPLGYGPSTLPLRHSAISVNRTVVKATIWEKTKEKKNSTVRSGIRTHAHRSGLRPERSALDLSAILTTCQSLKTAVQQKE